MKHLTIAVMTAGLFLLFVTSPSQDKGHKGMDPSMHMKMMEMMKDSSMMDMMMGHIAGDQNMRMAMMHKMMSSVSSDTASMMEMCKTMMGDGGMKSCMMKMMDGGMKEEKSGHENHH